MCVVLICSQRGASRHAPEDEYLCTAVFDRLETVYARHGQGPQHFRSAAHPLQRTFGCHHGHLRRCALGQSSSTESRPRWTPTSVETLRMASRAPSAYGRALVPASSPIVSL